MDSATTTAVEVLGATDDARLVSSPRTLRRDLRFVRIYAFQTDRVLRYSAHEETLGASDEPLAVADRIERGLAGEARRYRLVGWCILALLAVPPLLSGFLWSAMYWLPIRIYWWPFDRGNYGLPFFSLFEWLLYLVVAAYFVITVPLLFESRTETRKLGTDLRRVRDASTAEKNALAKVIAEGAHPRTESLVRHSKAFSAYAPLLDQAAD